MVDIMSKRLFPAALVGGLLLAFVFAGNTAFAVTIRTSSNHDSGFFGAWCAQGSPRHRASIVKKGSSIVLTNERGNSAEGYSQGSERLTVPAWNSITGTLADKGRQINWSNGTYWLRCHAGGRRRPRFVFGVWRINGIWFAQGNPKRVCSINQLGNSFSLRNEKGSWANGSFTSKYSIRTSWNGKVIRGRISRNGNRIRWDNGTYWVRALKFR